jgi:hypothetical protein
MKMAQQPQQGAPQFQIAFVDLPELSETFADSVEKVGVENGIWKFDFAVTRLGEPQKNGTVIPGKKIPACRLVLPMNAGLDLANKVKGLIEIMEKQGVLKTIQPANVVAAPGGGKPS